MWNAANCLNAALCDVVVFVLLPEAFFARIVHCIVTLSLDAYSGLIAQDAQFENLKIYDLDESLK